MPGTGSRIPWPVAAGVPSTCPRLYAKEVRRQVEQLGLVSTEDVQRMVERLVDAARSAGEQTLRTVNQRADKARRAGEGEVARARKEAESVVTTVAERVQATAKTIAPSARTAAAKKAPAKREQRRHTGGSQRRPEDGRLDSGPQGPGCQDAGPQGCSERLDGGQVGDGEGPGPQGACDEGRRRQEDHSPQGARQEGRGLADDGLAP